MNSASMRVHAIVEGHVQGVGYRMFVIEQARRLDVTGWVRNRSDGTVEVTAEGTRLDLDEFVSAMKGGPHLATVTNVETRFAPAKGEFRQFWFLETD
jgi:acylphosphatase